MQQYNVPDFISNDPISIPRRFAKVQDIEISGFFAAILAWGNRKSIINSCDRLLNLMDNEPYYFVRDHSEKELKRMLHFTHRTFQPTDLLYFIYFLRHHYQEYESLETGFTLSTESMEGRLNDFRNYFIGLPDFPERTGKHIASPARKSTCKRLNMFLRWMVRSDDAGVDFGIWKNIPSSQLICPFDVHVARVSRELGLIRRKQNDWSAAMELTTTLRQFDFEDPARYDFALFGLGIEQKRLFKP